MFEAFLLPLPAPPCPGHTLIPFTDEDRHPEVTSPGSHDSHLVTSWVICLAQASCRMCYLLFIPEHWSQPCLLSPRFWFCSDLIVCPSVKLRLFSPKSSPSSPGSHARSWRKAAPILFHLVSVRTVHPMYLTRHCHIILGMIRPFTRRPAEGAQNPALRAERDQVTKLKGSIFLGDWGSRTHRDLATLSEATILEKKGCYVASDTVPRVC